MRSLSCRFAPIGIAALTIALIAVSPVAAQLVHKAPASAPESGSPAPAPVNVIQDCWTTNLGMDPDPEFELYSFLDTDAIDFIWKQKLLLPCTSYTAKIIGTECTDGKPPLIGSTRTFQFDDIPFGPLSPIPGVPEPLLSFTTAPGAIPVGRHDWFVLIECDDTDGTVTPDGDIDDVCGANKGFAAGGPLILGPEPVQFGDPDPGGFPAGRGPGEEGTTRAWCFEVCPSDTPLVLGDDASIQVPLGFDFPFQGSTYSTVFVNSNGNLTFGSGDGDFSESVGEFLSDQPRIAALWDDLSPNNGGTVDVSYAGCSSATVSFTDVPEFFSTGANSFDITLEPDGTVTIAYGTITALDGLAGVTEGGGAADPGETDLSAAGSLSAVGTTYEHFTAADNDLTGLTLVFDP